MQFQWNSTQKKSCSYENVCFIDDGREKMLRVLKMKPQIPILKFEWGFFFAKEKKIKFSSFSSTLVDVLWRVLIFSDERRVEWSTINLIDEWVDFSRNLKVWKIYIIFEFQVTFIIYSFQSSGGLSFRFMDFLLSIFIVIYIASSCIWNWNGLQKDKITKLLPFFHIFYYKILRFWIETAFKMSSS